MNMRELPGEFGEFRKLALLSMEEISREIYMENRETISVKKEHLAIKNLGIIFDATLRLSVEKGFHAMSLRDLCREAGLSMGALYSYIPGKEKLLDIILQQGRRIVKKTLEDALEGKENPVEKLHAAVRAHIYLSEVLQRWFFFAFMETKNLSREEQQAAMASELYTEKIFIDILEEGIEARDLYGEGRFHDGGYDKSALTGLVSQKMEVFQTRCKGGRLCRFYYIGN